jgi:hypothetical protein
MIDARINQHTQKTKGNDALPSGPRNAPKIDTQTSKGPLRIAVPSIKTLINRMVSNI